MTNTTPKTIQASYRKSTRAQYDLTFHLNTNSETYHLFVKDLKTKQTDPIACLILADIVSGYSLTAVNNKSICEVLSTVSAKTIDERYKSKLNFQFLYREDGYYTQRFGISDDELQEKMNLLSDLGLVTCWGSSPTTDANTEALDVVGDLMSDVLFYQLHFNKLIWLDAIYSAKDHPPPRPPEGMEDYEIFTYLADSRDHLSCTLDAVQCELDSLKRAVLSREKDNTLLT
jgi:hypothetical protein